MTVFNEPTGQDWPQICQLLLAVGLSALIGIERQLRQKSAGLRTNTLVGMGSALFMLVSKFGFMDILSQRRVVVDPSRIAAQIVSGIGFIGGGIIFKQQSEVRGLTTAAAVWLTSAVGSACAAGLPILACIATGLYFVMVVIIPFVWIAVQKIYTKNKTLEALITVRYRALNTGLEPILDGIIKAGAETVAVRRIEEIVLSSLHSPAYALNSPGVERQSTRRSAPHESPLPPPMLTQGHSQIFDVELLVSGHESPNGIASSLSQLPSVISVAIHDNQADEV